MTEPIERYDFLEASYHRAFAAPIVFPKPKFSIGQLLKDSDGDVVQIIGLEWCLTDVNKEDPYWTYVIWDVALGCVLDMEESLLSTYTLT
jgi:hypothetical protein